VASWHGFPDIVKYFCHFGCDVNIRNKVTYVTIKLKRETNLINKKNDPLLRKEKQL
jgi:hypothetical protein